MSDKFNNLRFVNWWVACIIFFVSAMVGWSFMSFINERRDALVTQCEQNGGVILVPQYGKAICIDKKAVL